MTTLHCRVKIIQHTLMAFNSFVFLFILFIFYLFLLDVCSSYKKPTVTLYTYLNTSSAFVKSPGLKLFLSVAEKNIGLLSNFWQTYLIKAGTEKPICPGEVFIKLSKANSLPWCIVSDGTMLFTQFFQSTADFQLELTKLKKRLILLDTCMPHVFSN